ncbi:MAG: MFS transporter [Steroidobacteraceae bacterium]
MLALVSLLNDAASEMIAPLLPIFLTAVMGAGPAIVGLVDGVSEATSSVLKLLAGRLSDRGVSARGLMIGGYALANVARPLIGLATAWPDVLGLRFLDRVGKGLRTAPRDVLLAASVDNSFRGRAFGVHRSADHIGAMLGPLIAAALLAFAVPLRHVFLLAGIAGALVLFTLFGGLPPDAPDGNTAEAPRGPAPFSWRLLDTRLQVLLVATTLLALAGVSEAFVVLWAAAHGLAVVWVPIVWAAAHAAKALIAWPAGELADRQGSLRVLAFGWPLRIVTLAVLALVPARGWEIWAAFIAYSMSLATTEAAERTLIAEAAAPERRGTAFGWFYLLTGIVALPGGILFGVLWQTQGARASLLAAAALSALACLAAALAARRGSGAASAIPRA